MKEIPTVRMTCGGPPASLGEILGAALGYDPAAQDPWEVIDAIGEMIAAHYRIDRDLVMVAILELAVEVEEDTGFVDFGHLLERPWGASILAFRVAQMLLGEDVARTLPCLILSYH